MCMHGTEYLYHHSHKTAFQKEGLEGPLFNGADFARNLESAFEEMK